MFHLPSGKRRLASFSVCSTFLPVESPHRNIKRWICVSTGKAGTPKAWLMTTEAVLCPTPGIASRSVKLSGTWPSCNSMIISERPLSALDFMGTKPQGRMIAAMSSMLMAAIACGVGASAKRIGVMVFTRASVHWADKTTATNRVNGS